MSRIRAIFEGRLVRMLVVAALAGVALPAAAAAPVAAASYTVVSSAPCSATNYGGVYLGTGHSESAELLECFSGGYWYVRPQCSVVTTSDGYFNFRSCLVRLWTTGGTYVTAYGFSNYSGHVAGGSRAAFVWTSWVKLSGYRLSAVVGADNSSACYIEIQSYSVDPGVWTSRTV